MTYSTAGIGMWLFVYSKKHLPNDWLLDECEHTYNIHICKSCFQILFFTGIALAPTVEYAGVFYSKEGVVVIRLPLLSPVLLVNCKDLLED